MKMEMDFLIILRSIPDEYKYDCIIVDEAQDYDVDMGLSIRALLKEDYSTFYVFLMRIRMFSPRILQIHLRLIIRQ